MLNARSTPSLGETDHVEHAPAVLVREEPVRARRDALEQLGAPLRQFILWQRMAAAFKLINEGKSIKEAALTAGFSDPAHFSRTFVQNNGLTPSVYWGRRNNLNVVFFLSA